MGELVKLVIEIIHMLWPFRIIEQWERGVYAIRGKFWRTFGPGLVVVVPWFTNVRTVTVKPFVINTDRLDLSLHDGKTVSFIASATVEVLDAAQALNDVDNYHETTLNLLESIVSDRIARADASRLDAAKRPRLQADLARWITEETSRYGVRVSKVRFSSFVLNPRVYRLLGSNPASTDTSW